MDVLGNGAVLLMRLMLENENSLVVAVVVADYFEKTKVCSIASYYKGEGRSSLV